jgi:ankyrin repeat protein
MYLDEFKPLLNELYENYLSQPMEGQDGQAVAVNPDIQHPHGSGLIPDSLDKAKARVEWNEYYSRPIKYQGKFIYRMNHGLAHTIRSMVYAPMVIEYLSHYGKGNLKKEAAKLNKPDGIKKIMLLGAFSSIARTSEIDFGKQPAAHQYYRRQAGKIFKDYYQNVLNGKVHDDINKLFKLFQNEQEFVEHHKALVAMGDDNNHDPIHIILNICHKLDLYRCRVERKAQKSVDRYIRKYSEGNYGEAFWALINQSVDIIKATGDQVKAKKIERKDKDNDKTFLACNSSVKKCISVLQNMPAQKIPTQPNDDDNPWLDSFFYKSIRADESDFWDEYLLWVTHTSINCDPHPPNRYKDKKRYTTKMVRYDNKLRWEVVERSTAKPMYSSEEKKEFSKASSLSYARPLQGYEPKVFGWNRGRTGCLVGIRLSEDKVRINRIMIYDNGTVDRPYDFDRKNLAKLVLAGKLANDIYCNSLGELVQSSSVNTYNEVLGRVHNKISAIAIFSDNLQSRLLAQLRARQYEKRLKERAEELGEPFNKPYKIPIVYYIPGSSKNHTVYDHVSQAADRNHIAKKTKPFGQHDDVQKCEEYLEKLENVQKEPGFIKKNEIKQVHILAAYGDKKALAKHLDANPNDINLQDEQGKTAAHYAAQNDHVEILKLLKERGDASVFKVKNKKGLTPFTAAIDKKNKDVIEYFLKEGIVELDTFKRLIKLINCFPEGDRFALLQRHKAQWLKNKKLTPYVGQLEMLIHSLKPEDKIKFLNDKFIFYDKLLKNNKIIQSRVNLNGILSSVAPNDQMSCLKDVLSGKWLKDNKLIKINIDLDGIVSLCKLDDQLQFLNDIFVGDEYAKFLKDALISGEWLKDNLIQNVADLKNLLKLFEQDDHRLMVLRDILGGEWLKDKLIENTYDFKSFLAVFKKEDNKLKFLRDIIGGKWLGDKGILNDYGFDLTDFLSTLKKEDSKLEFLREIREWLKKNIKDIYDLKSYLNIFKKEGNKLKFLEKALDGKWIRDKNLFKDRRDLKSFLDVFKEDDNKLKFLRDGLDGEWLKDKNLFETYYDLKDFLHIFEEDDNKLKFLEKVLGGKWIRDKNLFETCCDLKGFLHIFEEDDNKLSYELEDILKLFKTKNYHHLVFLKDIIGIKWLVDKGVLSSSMYRTKVLEIVKILDEKQILKWLSDPDLVKSGLFNNQENLDQILSIFNEDNQIALLTTPDVTEELEKNKLSVNYELQMKIDKIKLRSFLSQLAQNKGYNYKMRYKNIIKPNATLQENIINILNKPISSYYPTLFFSNSYKKYKLLRDHALSELECYSNNSSPEKLEKIIINTCDNILSHYCYDLLNDYNPDRIDRRSSNNIKDLTKLRAEQTFMRRLACCYQMVVDNNERELDESPGQDMGTKPPAQQGTETNKDFVPKWVSCKV